MSRKISLLQTRQAKRETVEREGQHFRTFDPDQRQPGSFPFHRIHSMAGDVGRSFPPFCRHWCSEFPCERLAHAKAPDQDPERFMCMKVPYGCGEALFCWRFLYNWIIHSGRKTLSSPSASAALSVWLNLTHFYPPSSSCNFRLSLDGGSRLQILSAHKFH